MRRTLLRLSAVTADLHHVTLMTGALRQASVDMIMLAEPSVSTTCTVFGLDRQLLGTGRTGAEHVIPQPLDPTVLACPAQVTDALCVVSAVAESTGRHRAAWLTDVL